MKMDRKLSVSGGFAPWPHQGLCHCVCALLLSSDPIRPPFRLVLRVLAMVRPLPLASPGSATEPWSPVVVHRRWRSGRRQLPPSSPRTASRPPGVTLPGCTGTLAGPARPWRSRCPTRSRERIRPCSPQLSRNTHLAIRT